jgi:hypothetical protein
MCRMKPLIYGRGEWKWTLYPKRDPRQGKSQSFRSLWNRDARNGPWLSRLTKGSWTFRKNSLKTKQASFRLCSQSSKTREKGRSSLLIFPTRSRYLQSMNYKIWKTPKALTSAQFLIFQKNLSHWTNHEFQVIIKISYTIYSWLLEGYSK